MDKYLLTGDERKDVWQEYKLSHPDPELAKAEDFHYVQMLLKEQVAKVLRVIREDAELREYIINLIVGKPEPDAYVQAQRDVDEIKRKE